MLAGRRFLVSSIGRVNRELTGFVGDFPPLTGHLVGPNGEKSGVITSAVAISDRTLALGYRQTRDKNTTFSVMDESGACLGTTECSEFPPPFLMKTSLAALGLFLVTLLGVHAAPLGPRWRSCRSSFGKEKQFQQVVIGLYDNAAPLTVANFKELCNKKFVQQHALSPRISQFTSSKPVIPRAAMARPTVRALADQATPCRPSSAAPILAEPSPVARLPDHINPAKASNGSQFYTCLAPSRRSWTASTPFSEKCSKVSTCSKLSAINRQIVTIFHWQRS